MHSELKVFIETFCNHQTEQNCKFLKLEQPLRWLVLIMMQSISRYSDNATFSLFWTTGRDDVKAQWMQFRALKAGVFQQWISTVEIGVKYQPEGVHRCNGWINQVFGHSWQIVCH